MNMKEQIDNVRAASAVVLATATFLAGMLSAQVQARRDSRALAAGVCREMDTIDAVLASVSAGSKEKQIAAYATTRGSVNTIRGSDWFAANCRKGE